MRDKSWLSRWYPPSRFVFLPTYRFLRRRTGPSAAQILLALFSGVLHGLLFGLGRQNGLAKGLAMGALFALMGIVGYTLAGREKQARRARTRLRKAQSQTRA